MKIVVVGATGAVGSVMLDIISERDFPVDDLVPVASARSEGRLLRFRDADVRVVELNEGVFDGVDIALFDTPDEVSLQWAPRAVSRGAIVVDNSAAWRADPDVPLVVPEVNPELATDPPKGIIASPNCTMLAIVLPLAALHRAFGLEGVVMSSYQSASGAGKAGADELWDQMQMAAKDPEAVVEGTARDILKPGKAFTHPLALNVIPQIGSARANGYTGEEVKVGDETRKVLRLPDLPVTATCVRVPTMVGHGVSVHARFKRPVSADEARSILEEASGVEVLDDPAAGIYPTPQLAAGRDPCYVGRIRANLHDAQALDFFSVADNLRKGAALNTVQIAELLI